MRNKRVERVTDGINRLQMSIRSSAAAFVRRTIVPFALAVVAMVAFEGVAANAETTVRAPTADTDLSQFIGCMDVTAFKSLAPLTNSLTGKLITLLVIGGMIVFIYYGGKMLFAGNRVDRAQDSIAGIRNVFLGVILLSVGLGILLASIPLFFVGLCS